jgi:hypothetical protein
MTEAFDCAVPPAKIPAAGALPALGGYIKNIRQYLCLPFQVEVDIHHFQLNRIPQRSWHPPNCYPHLQN